MSQYENLKALAKTLEQIFPEIGAIASLKVLGEGFRSIVVETDGGQVFRIGKNSYAARGYRKEIHLLPILRPYLPFSIPEPRWYKDCSRKFPFGVMGYPKLPGQFLSPKMLSKKNQKPLTSDIARFLLSLHRFPLDKAVELGVPDFESLKPDLEEVRQETLSLLQNVVTRAAYREISRWWDDFIQDGRMQQYTPVLLHGDLWYEHILVNKANTTVVGILDFEEAAIGDPAHDLSTQFHLGKTFAKLVLHAYQDQGGVINEWLWYRMNKLYVLRELTGLLFSIKVKDPVEIEESIKKVQRCFV
ncbi:MAG: phosphotransferase family protein [Promethearchaeota archaeon]